MADSLTEKKTISYEDAQMYLLLKLILDDEKAFIKYMGIRRAEIALSKSMELFTNKKDSITLHDFTRWLMKNRPEILQAMDEAIEKLK